MKLFFFICGYVTSTPSVLNQIYIFNSTDFIVLASKLPIAYMVAEFVLVNSAAYQWRS